MISIRRFVKSVMGETSAPSTSTSEAPGLSSDDHKVWNHVKPYTMTSIERVVAVIDAVKHIHRHAIPGAIVECGVWRGGSAMAAMLSLIDVKETNREVYLYDTFEGMPPPTEKDTDYTGSLAASQLAETPRGTGVWCYATIEDVKKNIATTSYPQDRLHYIAGKVEHTIPHTIPDSIALLRLDTDWYESTKHELVHLFPRLSQGGILIIDDYGHWQGSKRATDEYFELNNIRMFLSRIDYTGRIGVKV